MQIKQIIYTDDFDFLQLQTQLSLLHALCDSKSISSLIDFKSWFDSCAAERKCRYHLLFACSNWFSLGLLPVQLVAGRLVAGSFSAFHHVKTYFRSSMLQSGLNHAMVLHVHKYKCDAIAVSDVLREYVMTKPNRESLFAV